MGRQRPVRVPGPPDPVVAGAPDHGRHPGPARAPRPAVRLGWWPTQLQRDPPRAARAGRDAGPAAGWSPVCRPAVAAILARAEGIPLYAVETVRMLVTDDRLVARGRRLRRPRSARPAVRPRDAPCPRRRAAGRARAGRSVAPPGRRGPRVELHRRRPGRPVGDRSRSPRRPAGRARDPRAPADGRRPALAGARPVPVRPGGHPRGRLQHADEARATGAPPRRRPVLRDHRRRGAGQHPRLPLPRRLPQRDGRGRGRHARRPGPGGAPRRGGSGDPAPLVRPGDVVLHPGPGGDRRSRRADHAQGAGRGGGELRRALRRGDAPARGGCGRTPGCRRPARRRTGHG